MATVSIVCILLLALLSSGQLAYSQDSDQLAMLALHKELMVPGWDANSSNYCSWSGVRCNLNRFVEWLQLPRRQLIGNISIISELKYMRWLDLSSNYFHGSVPYTIGKLSELEFLDLSGNKFEGLIPSQLGNLKNLRALNLSDNLLTGEIPDELQSLGKLQYLQLSRNRLNGSIPSWAGNLTNLGVFNAYENFLGGPIPENLGLVSDLRVLNLHSNQLEGPIPPSIFASGTLETLVLTANHLEGSIPQLVGKCRRLSNLRIGNNMLVGTVPAEIGNVTSLTYFEVNNNRLSGEIVPELAQCFNLTLLNLADNGFTGPIPHELGGLGNLQELIVSSNSLIGEIPKPLLRLKNLSKLDLSNNRFNGSMPEDLCNMSRLQFLLLSENSFRGEIPHEIGNCIRLLEFQMASNYLTGSIPLEIGRIRNLQIALNLSFNHLHGPIPHELGKLDKLVSLDISNNQLSGNIPSELKGMVSLIEVNFSNNLLTGPVPTFGPFQKSSKSSFLGNKALCGQPLSSTCGSSSDQDKDTNGHKVSYRIILAVIGSGLTVFVTVTVIVLLFMMREKREKAAKASSDVVESTQDPPSILASSLFVDNLKQAVDFECCVKATLKDSNKLTCGTFSIVYKAVMPSGLILSVKRLRSMDRTVSHQQNKMIRELERLGKLCHNNLLRPLGYVIYEDVALLLHQYFPNGTLIQLLQESTKGELQPDWPRRLSIAIGVAEGLAFLHNVAIIHLDISSSNVFLDGNFNPLLGEIEISKLLDPSRGTASISAVAGSFGYMPPEYAYTMQVTAPGNVYSYGVVLLEILTTQLPVDEAFGEGIDLVKWVHSAPVRGETPEQILDARLSTVSFAWRKQMLGVLKIALMCTDSTPAKRPKMKKVIEMLKEVQQS